VPELALPTWLGLPLLLLRSALWLFAYRHGLDYDSVRKIEPGMSAAQVKTVLGIHPGDYTVGRVMLDGVRQGSELKVAGLGTVAEHKARLRSKPPLRPQQWWYTNKGSVCVIFNSEMKVDAAYFWYCRLDDRHGPTRLLIRLGLADGEPLGFGK
jgi:hypothetical protein